MFLSQILFLLPFDLFSRVPLWSRRLHKWAISYFFFFLIDSLFLPVIPGVLSTGPSLEWAAPHPAVFNRNAISPTCGKRVLPPVFFITSYTLTCLLFNFPFLMFQCFHGA